MAQYFPFSNFAYMIELKETESDHSKVEKDIASEKGAKFKERPVLWRL